MDEAKKNEEETQEVKPDSQETSSDSNEPKKEKESAVEGHTEEVPKEESAKNIEHSAPTDEEPSVPVPSENKSEEIEESVEESSSFHEREKRENRQLIMLLVVFGVLFVSFVIGYYGVNSTKNFVSGGLPFDIVEQRDVTFYHTAFVIERGIGQSNLDYNVFIRSDPRDLEDIPFEGEMTIKSTMVTNSNDPFHCDGRGIIAVANMANLYNAFDARVINDANATCSQEGAYTYLFMNRSDQNKITQFGPSCYNLEIADCSILEVTEKFMLETIKEYVEEQNPQPATPDETVF